ncbi:MAG: ORF6N domain-containing protein [Chitinophagaceae bacterium]|nr:ORF6N domain-containing protein [Chitinophagaceae bacterium]
MQLTIIQQKIHALRGEPVILDFDISELYQVDTKVLNQAVKRNLSRFPEDFMFQLTEVEWENLRSQFVTSSWGGRRYLPYAFTEHGVTMLASVLKSKIKRR